MTMSGYFVIYSIYDVLVLMDCVVWLLDHLSHSRAEVLCSENDLLAGSQT